MEENLTDAEKKLLSIGYKTEKYKILNNIYNAYYLINKDNKKVMYVIQIKKNRAFFIKPEHFNLNEMPRLQDQILIRHLIQYKKMSPNLKHK